MATTTNKQELYYIFIYSNIHDFDNNWKPITYKLLEFSTFDTLKYQLDLN